jgi:transposase
MNRSDTVNAWMGVDISKDTLDVCLTTGSGYHHHTFANTTAGFSQLVSWQQQLAPEACCHYCLESTGPYGQSLALFLAEGDQRVSVVNPSRVKHFSLSQGNRNKTDRADARLLCDFCVRESPSLWRAAAPEVRELLSLMRRLDEIAAHKQQEVNRLQAPTLPKHVLHSVQNLIKFLDKETKRLEREVKSHIDRHPDLKNDLDLLTSVPGIGETTALRILCEMPDVDQFASAKQVAAYAGLSPREHRSGKSVRKRTRINKAGNGRLRKAMYFPALTATRHNPLVQAFYHRLLERGLCPMAALAACMRKLLMIAYGVLKHQQPFSPGGYLPNHQPAT